MTNTRQLLPLVSLSHLCSGGLWDPGGREEPSIWQSEGQGTHRSHVPAHTGWPCDMWAQSLPGESDGGPVLTRRLPVPHDISVNEPSGHLRGGQGTGHLQAEVAGAARVLVLEREAAGPEMMAASRPQVLTGRSEQSHCLPIPCVPESQPLLRSGRPSCPRTPTLTQASFAGLGHQL